MTHVIGQFDELQIAEATPASIMIGKSLGELQLRERLGVNVLGVWDRGRFAPASAETQVTPRMVLVLAGTQQQLLTYDETYCIYNVALGPVIIIGGGRVGRAAARALAARELAYRVIEQRSERIRDPETYVRGDAAELKTLEQAGIRDAPAVLITTHDAATNVYLTIFLRKLRPDLQIISRGGWEGDANALHRVGSDFVMSYPSMGANVLLNLLTRGDTLMVAEGLDLFRVTVPDSLIGKTIAEAAIREKTGCTVIALDDGTKTTTLPPDDQPLPRHAEIIVIGSTEAEAKFLERYGNHEHHA